MRDGLNSRIIYRAAIPVPLEGVPTSGHLFSMEKKSSAVPLYAALLTVLAAIGGLAPTLFFTPHGGTDWPDDLGLTASVVPQSYRQGDGGPFSDTKDTYISSGAADTNFGHAPKLLVDGSGCKVAIGVMCKTMIKFPQFIGTASGQVPPGATIVSADLQFVVTNRGGKEGLYQITQAWTQDSATWNSFSPAGAPTTQPRESWVYPSVLGLFSIDIKSIVQHWVDGDANEGILLASDDTNGVDYESSESANPPTLTVQFSPAPPPMTIQIQDLGALPGLGLSQANAINNAGQVVGVSYDSDYSVWHAFLWQGGAMTDLGVIPGDLGSRANDINDAGQVVGESRYSASSMHAVLWANGSMTSLPTLGGSACSAAGINNGGQIVGTCADASPVSHLVRWENGAITDLGTDGLIPEGINDDGQIVGEKYYGGSLHATLWDHGVLTDLGTLNGAPDSYGLDINDAGQVVGYNSGSPYHALRWEAGIVMDLGTLPGGGMSTGDGINEAGQVVGYSTTTETGGAHAYLWSDGWMADLGDLGYGGSQAYDLNDAGLVVGSSVASINGPWHAVLWTITPVPPPSGPVTLTFQKGDGGSYSETDDTYISSGLPNANYGAGVALSVDASGCKVSAATVCKALIRFPNVIGSDVGQVTPGSIVVSAILQFEITNPGGTQMLYQLTEGWTESGATWNGFTTPGAPTTKGAAIAFNAPLGLITVNITAIVQNWVNGDANYGVLIWSSSTDGVDYRSSESVNPPKLIVTFRSP